MEGTICLNVDGSLLGSSNSAGYGGLLRNHNGEFIYGWDGVNPKYSLRGTHGCDAWFNNMLGEWIQED
jgi:hypothetical protein